MNFNSRPVRKIAVGIAEVQYKNRPVAFRTIISDRVNADVGNSPATAVGLNIAQSHLLQLPSSFADFRHSCLPNERTLAASIWQKRKSKRLASNLKQQRRRNRPNRAAPIPSQ
jgi:hypothetical protein